MISPPPFQKSRALRRFLNTLRVQFLGAVKANLRSLTAASCTLGFAFVTSLCIRYSSASIVAILLLYVLVALFVWLAAHQAGGHRRHFRRWGIRHEACAFRDRETHREQYYNKTGDIELHRKAPQPDHVEGCVGVLILTTGLLTLFSAVPALFIYWFDGRGDHKKALQVSSLVIGTLVAIVCYLRAPEEFPSKADKLTFFSFAILFPPGVIEFLL